MEEHPSFTFVCSQVRSTLPTHYDFIVDLVDGCLKNGRKCTGQEGMTENHLIVRFPDRQ